MAEKFATIDEYIATFPETIQARLQEMREIIREAAPDAEEAISYQMPTFKLHSILVHFAGWQHHVGLYALPSAHEAFKADLAAYKHAKGSVQFPHDRPLPRALIQKMVRFRVKENIEKTARKRAR
jgi:uncharacterized protein YdhG (YjbR/CyaY superfamily)